MKGVLNNQREKAMIERCGKCGVELCWINGEPRPECHNCKAKAVVDVPKGVDAQAVDGVDAMQVGGGMVSEVGPDDVQESQEDDIQGGFEWEGKVGHYQERKRGPRRFQDGNVDGAK